MTNYGWNLPPGCPGSRETEVEIACVNPDCPAYLNVDSLSGTWEFGSVSLHHEDDVTCPDCGWERADPSEQPYVIVQTPDTTVLVSTRDDEAILSADGWEAVEQLRSVRNQLQRRHLDAQRARPVKWGWLAA